MAHSGGFIPRVLKSVGNVKPRSVGGGGGSMPTAGLSRPSQLPPSSGFENAGAKAVNKLPDIRSKSYSKIALQNMVEFLIATDYGHKFSIRLSMKELSFVFEHMMRQMEVNYTLSMSGKKFEDEFLWWLKQFNYPFNISRQHIATPAAPHAWPFIIAALDWLRVQIGFFKQGLGIPENSEEGENYGEDLTGGDGSDSMDIATLVAHFYEASYIATSDEDRANLLKALSEEMNAMPGVVKASDLAELRQQIDCKKQEIEAVVKSVDTVSELQMKSHKLTMAKPELERALAVVDAKISDAQSKLVDQSGLDAEIERLEQALAEKRALLQAQKLSYPELENLLAESQQHDAALEDIQQQVENRKRISYETEIELANLEARLKPYLLEWNTLSSKIISNGVAGSEVIANLNEIGYVNSSEMFDSKVRPLLTSVRLKMTKVLQDLEKRLLEAKNQEKLLTDSHNQKIYDLKEIEGRVKLLDAENKRQVDIHSKRENAYFQAKLAHDKHLFGLKREISELETQVKDVVESLAKEKATMEAMIVSQTEEFNSETKKHQELQEVLVVELDAVEKIGKNYLRSAGNLYSSVALNAQQAEHHIQDLDKLINDSDKLLTDVMKEFDL